MLLKRVLSAGAAVAALCASVPASSQELPAPQYVRLSGASSVAKAALYLPPAGTTPHVAVLVMHRTSNYLSHIATRELPPRGFMVLGMNPRSDNNEAEVDFEANALDMKAGVNFLRSQPGITRVILMAHSGGGPASSFYAAVAENGVGYCKGSNKVTECTDALAGLTPVDGLMLTDAHPGISINALRSLNGAVTDERRPRQIDPSLDPFSPANGYNPAGASTYPEDFKRRYFKAQSQRMNQLIRDAQARLAKVAAGRSILTDDEPFIVFKGDGARLMELDPSIHHSTAKPQKLLKNDGSIVRQIVESVRPPYPGLREDNATLADGTMMLTAKSFLSGRAIKSLDSMNVIDQCSSNNSTQCALEHVSIPVMVAAMGGHYFVRDGERLYERAKPADKDFVVIEGATHGLGECTACETTPGQYANATKNLFDYMASWMNARF